MRRSRGRGGGRSGHGSGPRLAASAVRPALINALASPACHPPQRWTQWIFLQLFKKGLAYQAEVPVNWCPALGTVLANEEVIDGKSERGGHPVVRLPMKQWMLRITAYADRCGGARAAAGGARARRRAWEGWRPGRGVAVVERR